MVKLIMKSNKLLFVFFALILPLFIVKPVFAGFGISPAEIYNDHLKPGAVFEKEIVISRSEANEDLKVVIETELGEAENWIKFEPSKEFVFPKNESRKTIKAIITVPKNAQTKDYKGLLRIKASSMDSSASGVSIVQGARMEVTLVTTSLNVNNLSVKGIRITDTEWQKPINLFANIENSGNTQLAPEKIILEIQNLNKEILETQEVTKIEKVDPNTTKEIFVEFKNNLTAGEYFGIVKIFSDNREIYSDRLVFKITGGPAADGGQSVLSKSENSILFKHVGYLFLSLIPVVILSILTKKTNKKKMKRIYLLFIVLYLIIATMLVYFFHQKRRNDMAKPGDIGNVQGETIEITPTTVPAPVTNNSAPLIVNQTNSGYPIYRTPDFNSAIIYTAEEDETFTVISQIEGWYQVSTGNGTGGWLPQNSVKKSN